MKNLVNKIRLSGIPIWVSFYALILFIIGTGLGVSSLLDPTSAVNYVEGADAIAGAWAGRTLGLALGMGVALLMRSNIALTITFIGAFFREFGDLIGIFPSGQTNVIVVLVIFLVLDTLALALCIRSVKQSISESD